MSQTARPHDPLSGLIEMDPSWQTLLPWRDLIAAMKQHPRAVPHLTRYLERRLGLPPLSPTGSDSSWGRIADCPGDRLQQAVIRAGLCYYHAMIRTPIDGPRVRALIALFGEDHYDFAVTRAPDLARRYQLDEEHGDMDTAFEPEAIKLKVRHRGMVVLTRAADAGGPVSIRHLLFRLPRHWSRNVRDRKLPLSPEAALGLFLLILEDLDTTDTRQASTTDDTTAPQSEIQEEEETGDA